MNNLRLNDCQPLTTDQKIEESKKIIEAALNRFSNDELCIGWTGGKDSTTMLWLYRLTCKAKGVAMPRAMFIHEGYVFEEIMDLVNRVRIAWGVDIAIVKNSDVADKAKKVGNRIRVADLNESNRNELKKIGFDEESFTFEPESFVGNHLMKTVAMNSFLIENNIKALSTAIRWDEQEARVKESCFSQRTDPFHIRVHPILHFKERDIWDTIHRYGIPYCTLYDDGYRSLGAKGSTTKVSDLPAWEQDLENTSERAGRGQEKEQIMMQLRNLGYM